MANSKPKLFKVEFVAIPYEKKEITVVAMNYGDVPSALERYIKKKNGQTLRDIQDITYLQYLTDDVAISDAVMSNLLNQTNKREM